MNNLYRLLQKIKDNPAMYLNEPSITNLRAFLHGYLRSQGYLELMPQEGYILPKFNEWMQKTAKTNLSLDGFGIILLLIRDERDAFYKFFDLFEEFWHQEETLNNQTNENKIEESSSASIDNSKLNKFDFYDEILKNVKKRPGLFIGNNSITKLDMFFRGYSLARREVDAPLIESERNFMGFQSWVEEKYNIKSDKSWAQIILLYSRNEPEALQRFFELYEEYLNQKVQ